MTGEQGATTEIFEPNPFVPFHSGREDLTGRADEYRENWLRAGMSFDSINELHREQEHRLTGHGNFQSEIRGRRHEFPRQDVDRLRACFRHWEGKSSRFRLADEARLLFALRGTAAHAAQNHGFFSRAPMENRYTFSQTLAALGVDEAIVRQRSQLQFAEDFDSLDRLLVLAAEYKDAPWNKRIPDFSFSEGTVDGEPLYGLELLRGRPLTNVRDLREYLKGRALADIDYHEARVAAMERYPVCVDGETPFSMRYMLRVPLHEEDREPIEGNNTSLYDRLMDEGRAVCDPRGRDDVRSRWIMVNEDKRGVSDIGSFVDLKTTHGVAGFLGGAVTDAADSHKELLHRPFHGNLIHYMSLYLRVNYEKITGRPLITDDELAELTYLSAKGNVEPLGVSKSHPKLVTDAGMGSPLEAVRDSRVEEVTVWSHEERQAIPVSHVAEVMHKRRDAYNRMAA